MARFKLIPNRKLIDYSSINDKGAEHSTIYRLLPPNDEATVRAALLKAAKNPDQIPVFWARLNGKRQLCALSFIPELKWFAFTAVDLQAAQVLDQRLWMPLVVGAIVALLLLVGVQFAATERMLLTPLLKLTEAARAIGHGSYALELPPASRDEMGELTRSFGTMAQQVRTHTDELEGKVRERTSELVAVNAQITAANQKINDSIEYAGLLQNSILPVIGAALPHFVLWLPRDIVGGDFYLYREDENGVLLGVVDCAGHGVAGAIMTMLAHALFENALDVLPFDDPAAILTRVDARFARHVERRKRARHDTIGCGFGLSRQKWATRRFLWRKSFAILERWRRRERTQRRPLFAGWQTHARVHQSRCENRKRHLLFGDRRIFGSVRWRAGLWLWHGALARIVENLRGAADGETARRV